jgi:putative membrane protein
VLDQPGQKRVVAADTLWGLTALVLVGTGGWRALGGLEKGTAYYLTNALFWSKMALLGTVLLLEVWPMITLIRWRIALGRGGVPDTGRAGTFAAISWVQAALVVLLVVAATGMARGVGS